MLCDLREALLQELARLYRLKEEGKKVDSLIEECEKKLYGEVEKPTPKESAN